MCLCCVLAPSVGLGPRRERGACERVISIHAKERRREGVMPPSVASPAVASPAVVPPLELASDVSGSELAAA